MTRNTAAYEIIDGRAIIPGVPHPLDLNAVRTLAQDMARETDRHRVQGLLREARLLQASTHRLEATVAALAAA